MLAGVPKEKRDLKHRKRFVLRDKDDQRGKAITVKAPLQAIDCSRITVCLLQEQVPEGPSNLLTPPVIFSDTQVISEADQPNHSAVQVHPSETHCDETLLKNATHGSGTPSTSPRPILWNWKTTAHLEIESGGLSSSTGNLKYLRNCNKRRSESLICGFLGFF